MSDQTHVQERLTNVEDRLGRLENLLVSINEKLEHAQQPNVTETENTEKFPTMGHRLCLNAATTTCTRDMRSSR